MKEVSREIGELEECFKIMAVAEKGQKIEDCQKCYVPTCLQFKVKNITEVNFENLSASINGVLSINFLIFTKNQKLQKFLLNRLYWNKEELEMLSINRQKKIERDENFLSIMLNKGIIMKLPTTRTKEYQIQHFKFPVKYQKNGANIEGTRILYVVRKQFKVQITKNFFKDDFFAPFNFINLDFNLTVDQMVVQPMNEDDKHLPFKKIGFNILRITEPYLRQNLSSHQKLQFLSPMLALSKEQPFGKFDIVETSVEAYSHDERYLPQNQDGQKTIQRLFEDIEPTQHNFKPFKYANFKIPLYRFPVVDIMTIFIPLWLLSFISVYIFFQTTQIMNRIVNVAALMIAYAAIQPIVRQNMQDAESLTLVDLLIYLQLLVNVFFLVRTIELRNRSDDPTAGGLTNDNYNRWEDWLFIISIVISVANVIIITILVIRYIFRKKSYKEEVVGKKAFAINNQQNWTLNLMMDRVFARYRQKMVFFD